jgi:hypothetical protein
VCFDLPMKSLAVLVAILFLTAIFGGPIALGLSYFNVTSRRGRLIRRIAIFTLSLWTILTGLQFLIANVPVFVRFIGIAGMTFAGVAIFRETRKNNHKEGPNGPGLNEH